MGNLTSLRQLDLGNNRLDSVIPMSLWKLNDVLVLEGSIPESVAKLVTLQRLDLSHNNLSGTIPKSLEALQYLEYFDVSPTS
ncbi:hypothetical protein F511_40007 [Dorcoceras hygrometricum]|uniref:LRR receptor-like serine/threonine-protein kinase n=1 Tax=Dorcoceras hygrometricum TaxID=472368 RepID=A0A2Z7BNA7_9LAMI|nr:hypothetical protein F511_40007 [Dorcoceras hygrometricum]